MMRKVDPLNHWTYIRENCPEICTLHSTRLFPDDKIFPHILRYLHSSLVLQKECNISYKDLISSMASYVSAKSGVLVSYVSKLLKEEKSPNSEGYKNIIDGLLIIRLGLVISDETVRGVAFSDSKLAIKQ